MTDVKPVVGMVFRTKKAIERGIERTHRITAVRQGKIYFVSSDAPSWQRQSRYMALENWDVNFGEVVSLPEPKTAQLGPKLTDAQAKELHTRAHLAGMDAGGAVSPLPMVVKQHANQWDDTSPVVYREVVAGGVCGFAWVKIRPGNGSFARWLKKKGIGRADSYEGGMSYTVWEFGQSLERKTAYANAYAAVLQEAGIKAYAKSRMD